MRTIVGIGALAGIGFTVSLFITELAFGESVFSDEAKLGIFLGSAVAGIIGYVVLRRMSTPLEQHTIATERLVDEPA